MFKSPRPMGSCCRACTAGSALLLPGVSGTRRKFRIISSQNKIIALVCIARSLRLSTMFLKVVINSPEG